MAARGITGSRLKAFTYLGDTQRVRIGSGGGLLAKYVQSKYSFLFNTSHVVLRDMPDFFQKHVWITRHAIYSKTTRLKYRTQQPSVDVKMTSSLLSSKKKRFKTRVQ